MPRLGNYSASSLLSQTQAQANKIQAYKDQVAAYEYDLSPKDEASFNKYRSELSASAAKYKNDPAKQLTIQKNITSAYRSFNSAEIGRMSTSVKYGDTDNRTKYNQMLGLYRAAQQNGDANLAQSIESQLASLSVTIQNEDMAAASRAEADGRRALSSSRKQYQAIDKAAQRIESELEAAYRTGKKVTIDGKQIAVTPQFYAQQKGQLLAAQSQRLEQQIESGLDDDMGTLQTRLAALKASPDFVKYASENGYSATVNGVPSQGLKFDPRSRSYSLSDLPYTTGKDGQPQMKVGADGKNYIINRQYDKTTKDAESMTPFILPGFKVEDKAAADFGAKGYFDPIANKTIYDIGDLPGQADGKSILNFAMLDEGETYQDLVKLGREAGDKVGWDDVLEQTYMRDLPEIAGKVGKGFGAAAGLLGGALKGPGGIGRILGGAEAAQREKAAQAKLEAARKAAEAAAVARNAALMAPKPAPLPVFKKQMPAPYNPRSTAPLQNIAAAAPRGATPKQSAFNSVSAMIDHGIAANKKSPAPPPPKKPWWKFW